MGTHMDIENRTYIHMKNCKISHKKITLLDLRTDFILKNIDYHIKTNDTTQKHVLMYKYLLFFLILCTKLTSENRKYL